MYVPSSARGGDERRAREERRDGNAVGTLGAIGKDDASHAVGDGGGCLGRESIQRLLETVGPLADGEGGVEDAGGPTLWFIDLSASI